MEKALEYDFRFKIEVDNKDTLIASANNGSFAVTAQYNKSYCRRKGISSEYFKFYGKEEDISSQGNVLLNALDGWVKDNHSVKFL